MPIRKQPDNLDSVFVLSNRLLVGSLQIAADCPDENPDVEELHEHLQLLTVSQLFYVHNLASTLHSSQLSPQMASLHSSHVIFAIIVGIVKSPLPVAKCTTRYVVCNVL